MISESTLKLISHIFCGDEEDFYSYKSGPKLISFFNTYFDKTDKYVQGFPSRWIYVYNYLVELLNMQRFDDFLNIILSKEYLMNDRDVTQVDAVNISNEIYERLNAIVQKDMYIITRVNGRFHLCEQDEDLEKIGEGGFANVYKQKSTGLVLKQLKDDYLTDAGIRSRFKREFNITKSLQDLSGIIKVFDYDDSSCSYTMELAELTLENYFDNDSINETIRINCIRQILYIMSEVHIRDIIHRDLSPSNIFVIGGMLKIADFGLGKDLNVFTSHQTIHTNSFGQYYYCAPEQFMMLKESDKRSDVYSLGRIINFIMTGDSRKSNHIFRSVSEKASNQDCSYRYADANSLLRSFEKCVKYHENKENEKNSLEKIKHGVLDEGIENYIYELSPEKISEMLLNKVDGFADILITFMKCNDTQAQHIIQSIDQTYCDVCNDFSDYDVFSNFAYKVLNEIFPYTVMEIAANILNYIAYSVNRFNAQGLVEKIINIGVEPMIEDILISNI